MDNSKKRITMLIGHLTKNSIIYDLAIGLSKYHDVTVITGYPSRRVGSEGREYYLEKPNEIINDNLKIKRVGSKRGEGKNFIFRAIKYIFLTYKIYKKAKMQRTDIYYIYSTPPFLGLLAKKLSRKGLILYNAQDIFPDSYISLKNKKENSLFIKILRRQEKKVYKNSNEIITISEQMKNTLSSKVDDLNKIKIVKNWTNTNNYIPVSRTENILFKTFDLDRNKFYIVYGGNIGYLQDWELVLRIAKKLNHNNDIKFIIFGEGGYKEKLVSRIRELQIINTKVFPMLDESLAPSVYNLGDLVLVPLIDNMTNYAYPHKITNILSVGKPILGLLDYQSEISQELNHNKLGFVPPKKGCTKDSRFYWGCISW